MQSIIGSSLPANLVLQRGVKEYPFTIPLILSVEVGTLIVFGCTVKSPIRTALVVQTKKV